MNPHDLLAELDQLGITIEAQGDRLRYSPRSAITPDLAGRIKAHKPALLAILAGEHWEPDVCHDANEVNWQAIDEADRDYLLGPRDWPAPCPWCGGRLVHRAACDELRRDLVPIVPFGRHRGRRADDVPGEYLDWIERHEVGDERFRDELRRWRGIAIDKLRRRCCDETEHFTSLFYSPSRTGNW